VLLINQKRPKDRVRQAISETSIPGRFEMVLNDLNYFSADTHVL